ncbi:MAG: hypothetical protein ABW321_17885 [Polyangiales bacterium]
MAACALLLSLASSVRAEESLQVALFRAPSDRAEVVQLSAALDPVLHAELDKVPLVRVVAQPALDLPSLQLALDCVGETPSCLAVATERTQASGLVAPTITRTDSAVVLSLLLYDPRRASPMQVVTRRFPGKETDESVLKSVAALVHELFGLPPPEPPPEAAAVKPESDAVPAPLPTEPPEVADDKPSWVLPIVLGATGVALLGVGIGVGVASQSDEKDYLARRPTTNAQANAALDVYDRAERNALFANIAMGVGAAALAGGVLVVILQHTGSSEPEPPPTGTRISVGLGTVGLTSRWH